jgi:Rrf2 family cysteine metabolism transcriptional repressor
MKISTKGRYGTRALVELARHYRGGPVQLKDVAQKQQISLQYLERLMGPLTAAGLIHSSRGPKGGFRLARSPREIKLSHIIEAMEGPIIPVDCIENPEICKRSGTCASRDVWTEVQSAIFNVLDSITLAELLQRQLKKESQGSNTADWVV